MSREDTIAAANRYHEFDIDEDDDLQIATELIASFGNIRQEPSAHRRVVILLYRCIKRYLWTWKSLGFDEPGPGPAVSAVESWIDTGQFADGYSNLCLPIRPSRNGHPAEDCDEPAMSDLSNAASRLAYFCATRNEMDAAMILSNLFWADAEGLESDDEMSFCDWLQELGIVIAWDEDISD